MSSSRTLCAYSSAIPTRLQQPALVPISLSGTEGINCLFDYTVVLMTPDALTHLSAENANFALDDFLGRAMTVTIALDGSGSLGPGAEGHGSGTREISGLITAAKMLRQQGRHALYQVTLRPWLQLATLTTDCKIFQDQTVIEIFDTLFTDYVFPLDKRLIETYPKRDYQTQYNETDFAFFSRLCEEWGINYFFEHSDGAHRLVVIDSIGAHRHSPSSAYHTVDFHASGKHRAADYLHTFTPDHQLTSGEYNTRDHDYTRTNADLNARRYDPRPTLHNQQAVYQWHVDANFSQPKAGAGGAGSPSPNDPFAEGDMLARLRMQALRAPGQRAQGQGPLRGMVPGCVFTLSGHPHSAANREYLIVSTTLVIDEAADETQTIENAERQRYRVQADVTVQPTSDNLRPERLTVKPFTHGPSTARVVGPAGHNLWTDVLGRIKVQFPWDRSGRRDQTSSCWVRVASPWAGNQLGSMQVPRIGQEVIVDFIGGDPDLPICTGRVFNQMNGPPWALPGQSALSGLRSRELTPAGGNAVAGRSNHLVLDDTAGKIQSQLKSDHQHSQLSLGHITRIDDNAGRKDARGQGFELRTDGHGAIRARDGLLITTEARTNAAGHTTDASETVQRLAAAQAQQQRLAALAQQHGALEAADNDAVIHRLATQQSALAGSGGNVADNTFAEFSAPHLLLASPAGIATSTPQSTHIASGEQIALTSGESVSLSVGQRLIANVKNGIRFFTLQGGIKATSASGNVDLQALKHSVELLAKLNITMTAERITINAEEEVVINGGGSYTRWNADGITSGTSGEYIVHAAMHAPLGVKSIALPILPEPVMTKAQMIFDLRTIPGLALLSAEPYALYRDGILLDRGVTDMWGRVVVNNHMSTSRYEVEWSDGNRFALPVTAQPGEAQQELSRKGVRQLGETTDGRQSQLKPNAD